MNAKQARYTWEQAIDILRADPAHSDLVRDAYLTSDLEDNCRRFFGGSEFAETLRQLRRHAGDFKSVLDMPGGNGIATVAFAKLGFDVTSVEPDPSASVGRGAIESNLRREGLTARIVQAYGESLPLPDQSYDVVYVRQGLHHAHDLPKMASEIARVLKLGGVLLAAREHVVNDYDASLKAFLDSQVDHQLYGGEHAFTLPDYRDAFRKAGLETALELGPYDSPINMYPNTENNLRDKILDSPQGRLLRKFMPAAMVAKIGWWRLRHMEAPGRLYSFIMKKPASR